MSSIVQNEAVRQTIRSDKHKQNKANALESNRARVCVSMAVGLKWEFPIDVLFARCVNIVLRLILLRPLEHIAALEIGRLYIRK